MPAPGPRRRCRAERASPRESSEARSPRRIRVPAGPRPPIEPRCRPRRRDGRILIDRERAETDVERFERLGLRPSTGWRSGRNRRRRRRRRCGRRDVAEMQAERRTGWQRQVQRRPGTAATNGAVDVWGVDCRLRHFRGRRSVGTRQRRWWNHVRRSTPTSASAGCSGVQCRADSWRQHRHRSPKS